MRIKLFFLVAFIIPVMLKAQLPALGFANSFNSNGFIGGVGSSVTYDAAGNAYVCGSFGNTCDFDSSPTFSNITATAGGYDIFVAKYTSTGALVWAFPIGIANSNDSGYDIKLDNGGNVVVTGILGGSTPGTADFDPSPFTTYTLSSLGNGDAFLAKYTSSGNFIWAFTMGSVGTERGNRLAIDPTGNIYVTGSFQNTVDFNPTGTPINLSCANSYPSCYLAKYNGSGACQWAFPMGSANGSAMGECLCFDGSNNICVGGYFSDAATDFDPGAGVVNLPYTVSTGGNGFIARYSSNMVFQSAFSIRGPQQIDVSYINCDANGDLYATGNFYATADMDPSASTAILTSAGQLDGFVAKYDNTNAYQWAFQIGSPGIEYANCVVTDAASNIYVGGLFQGTTDFKGTSVSPQIFSGNSDMYLAKYNSAGNYIWNFTANTSSYTANNAMAIDAAGSIYTTGYFGGSNDFDPGPSNYVLPSTSAGGDIYLAKYTQCITPASPTNVTSAANSNVCSGNSATLSAASASTAINWYATPTSTPVIATGGVFTTSALTTGTAGPTTYSYYAGVTTCTPSPRTLVTVTVNPSPLVSVSGATLNCANKPTVLTASGAVGYSWNTSATTNTVSVSPAVTNVYNVTGTNSYNCSSSAAFTLNTTSLSAPNICLISVDSLGINNEIFWEKTLYQNADSFIVYREVSTNIYKRIAAISTNTYSSYTDTARSIGPANGDPNSSFFKYKLQIRDTCGNYSQLSPWHQSIFVIDQQNGNFQWNYYAIESSTPPITVYELYRINNATGTYSLVNSTTGNVLADPQYTSWQTSAKWRVQANGFNCFPTAKTNSPLGQKVKTKSNIKNDKLIGVSENELTNSIFNIYPSPTKDVVFLEAKTSNNISFNIEIQNSLGQVIYSKNYNSINEKIEIDLNEFKNGIYFIKIKLENKTIANKKIVKI